MECSICLSYIYPDRFTGWSQGHNAAPIKEGRCCPSCNQYLVIPVRLWEIRTDQKFKPSLISKVIENLRKGDKNA